LLKETDIDPDAIGNYKGVLEKKWNTIVRLQKKVS
jgi:hypothetical protein